MAGKSKRPIKTASEFGRETCLKCFRVSRLCICASVSPFQIEPLVVLLVHPREFMKTIGTVRIVKLSLTDSVLWRGFGVDFDRDENMQALLSDPTLHCTVLFPGENSLNLSTSSNEALGKQIPSHKRLAVFVIDGSWSSAKNMILQSQKLSALPKVSFEVATESAYAFRQQPKKFCLSTVEAVTLLIENLRQKNLCNPVPADGHLRMLKGFETLVQSQIPFEKRLSGC